MNNKAFTLIELLIAVLIIGILAAIAVPKYREAVEKSIMQEAITNLKSISQAQDIFYLQNGRYATVHEMDKIDIAIPGEIVSRTQTGLEGRRIKMEYFIFGANTSEPGRKGVAHRYVNNDIQSSILFKVYAPAGIYFLFYFFHGLFVQIRPIYNSSCMVFYQMSFFSAKSQRRISK